MWKEIKRRDKSRIGGTLTIRRFFHGELTWQSKPLPNKVVSSSGYGRNLITRQLAGDGTYPIEIDSAKLGTSSTAAADAQTDLIAATVSSIPITNKVAVDDDLTVDVFVTDANLPNGTYSEFGLFCNGQMLARIVISPSYTKGSGEDTLFTYSLGIAG